MVVAAPAAGLPATGPDAVQVHRLLDQAQQALERGRWARAQDLLHQVLPLPPDLGYAAYRHAALSARLALEQGQPAAAVSWAREAVGLAVPEESLEARLLLAEALQADARVVEAARTLVEALRSPAATFRGLLREDLLGQLGELARRIPGAEPAQREVLLEYARLLLHFGHVREAAVLLSDRHWQELDLEATSELARALGRLRQHQRRMELLQSTLRQAQDQPAHRLAGLWLQLAEEYVRLGQTEQAETLWRQVLSEDPRGEAAGQALLALVRQLLEQALPSRAQLEAALTLLDHHRATAGDSPGWQEAVWRLFVEILPRPSHRDLARRALELWLAARPDDPAGLYWTARLLETESASTGAEPPEQALLARTVRRLHRLDPISYHALLARQRWPKLSPPLWGADGAPAPEGSELPGDLQAVVALRQAGLTEAALGELRHRVARDASVPALRLLADWEREAGDHRAALRRYAALLARLDQAPGRAGEREGAGLLPRSLLEGLFPRAFRDRVEPAAAAWGVDPALLYAVMREESTFSPQAYSHARAFGLMQLLAPTAAWVAGQVGLSPPPPADLFDPAVNVELGAAYLGHLLDRFGRRQLAVAAYHAGPGRVSGWLGAWGLTRTDVLDVPPGELLGMDWVVERIPIPTTRRYVRSVERSWLMYRLLYGQT